MQGLDSPSTSQRGLGELLLATGPGKVGTLLTDGDWLLLSTLQSNVSLRHYFNHWCYGSRWQRASPHATSFQAVEKTYLDVREAACVCAT